MWEWTPRVAVDRIRVSVGIIILDFSYQAQHTPDDIPNYHLPRLCCDQPPAHVPDSSQEFVRILALEFFHYLDEQLGSSKGAWSRVPNLSSFEEAVVC